MDERESAMQRAFAEALRPSRSRYSFTPQLDIGSDFATYGGEARGEIPLGKNTTLGVTGGGIAGRGYGKAKGAKMPFTPRAGVELKYEF